MKTLISSRRASACALATVLGALVLQSPALADKRDGQAAPRWESKTIQTQRNVTGYERHTTWAGQNGKTRTVKDVTTRTDTGYNRETVVANPNGSTLTRDVTSSYDPATKTRTKEVTVDRTPPPAE